MGSPIRIDPGRLNRRLVLEEPTDLTDDQAGNTPAFMPVVEVWALAEPLAAESAERAGAVESEARWRLTVRADARITPACRFTDGPTVFDIVTVRDADGTGRYLICEALQEIAP